TRISFRNSASDIIENMKSAAISLFATVVLLGACAPAPQTVQASNSQASAYIQNKGSDTMVNLALLWAEAYQRENPDIRLSVTGGGSGTGFTALMTNTVDIANASRAIKPEEINEAATKNFKPIEYVVARDAIGVIVHPSNPVNQLTLEQISNIFQGRITNWSEVGGENRPIVRLSRESNSGTHVYFLETVIRMGQSTSKAFFSEDTLLLPSSEGIISEIQDNPNAIGYDGLGYITSTVKLLAVAKNDTSKYVLPSVLSVNNNEYPISRDLYMYTHGEPSGAVKQYLDWILGAEAQKIVAVSGFVPIKVPGT
ncbi:MAG TPA: phosphate ABC transporter substrate-binding protein, partial [Leptolinea sp.]